MITLSMFGVGMLRSLNRLLHNQYSSVCGASYPFPLRDSRERIGNAVDYAGNQPVRQFFVKTLGYCFAIRVIANLDISY